MAVDEVLLEAAAADDQCTLRFYRWSEPTLSLGYFQTFADRWQHEASRSAAAVRRMSGGGAILHDIELTYSLAVPSRHPLAIDRLGLYRTVHLALIEALAQWGIEATMFGGRRADEEVASGQWLVASEDASVHHSAFSIQHSSNPESLIPNPSSALAPQPFLCFQRRSPGDVLVGEVKIAGSAQRRCRGAVLQHGSVLLAQSPAAPELDGMQELTGKAITPEQLVEAWLARLGGQLGSTWRGGKLSDSQRRRATALAAEKYASAAWTESRGRT